MNLMTFLLDNWILVLAALTSGSLLLWPSYVVKIFCECVYRNPMR